VGWEILGGQVGSCTLDLVGDCRRIKQLFQGHLPVFTPFFFVLFIVCAPKWNIAPVAGKTDYFTIHPVADSTGLISSTLPEVYWSYGYPIGNLGDSAHWKITKVNNAYSEFVLLSSP
jgi:hypothetical protein